MGSVEKTARTVEEAVRLALDELGVSEDQVDVEVLAERGRGLLGILGQIEARVRVTVRTAAEAGQAEEAEATAAPEEEEFEQFEEKPPVATGPVAERARELLNRMLRLLGFRASSQVTGEDEENVYLEITGDDELGLLIGKGGQTLAAFQHLVGLLANRDQPERKRILLDAQGYRARRERSLQALAQNAARQVRDTGREVTLSGLNARERRIVHLTLKDDPDVQTRSEGEESNRTLVVAPDPAARPGGRGAGPARADEPAEDE
jgi:spoIIIJ-associated protein